MGRVIRCLHLFNGLFRSKGFAKKNGMYKNSAKTYRSGDKVGTLYDSNVWGAERVLKERKAQLAEAKKRFSEAKKKK